MATVPVMATLHLPLCHGHLPSGCVTQLAQRRSPALQPAVQPSQHMHCKARTGLANLSPGRKETRTTRYGELRPGVALVHIDRQHDLSLCCARREATAPFLAHLATLSARLGPRRSGSLARDNKKRRKRSHNKQRPQMCECQISLVLQYLSLDSRAREATQTHYTDSQLDTLDTPRHPSWLDTICRDFLLVFKNPSLTISL